ncbi:thiamine pyrophosphate-dependent acetolactate synthase large subunit-like protein [Tamaricihabitans halophyticus]|uniref:Thiamine pyrophosphate-dependent acetolactate synthase large subunit-like protein n=1 Tax=Tamaricihabitans halophyticus TaxID=1262583 RepID=A0A4V2SUI1_9PSEU|nr:thiamine pyrophosphate-binding protein [Tamaricihabitans halophyticus]TCP54226.1 thiamine pyrophosphate-dependent acetolactate synthase large subunit-like protein [Tamaricihabitans halophyticus]
MRVAELVGEVLAELGVRHAFGVVGSGNFHVTNALRAAGVPFTACRHEGGAATMADAYVRTRDQPAVVTVHQGCGLTNALTGIGEAAKSRTPLLVLAADTAGSAVLSNFRIDQDAAARSVGAVAERVHSAASAFADTVRAFRTAVEQRRTVVLNLPLDVQELQAPPDRPRPSVDWLTPYVEPDPARIAELAELLANAERPVFVAGRGAREAAEPLRMLAAHCGALLSTSAVANGLFEKDEWSIGISGGFASPLAAELIANADLVVGWGCALNMWTMRHGKLIGPAAKVAQVDIEPAALGAHRPIDLGLLGDVAATALATHRDLRDWAQQATGYRRAGIGERIKAEARWRDVPYIELTEPDRIDPRTLSVLLDDLLPAERVLAVDSGNFMGYPSAYLRVPDKHGFCFTQGFQSIGLGLATAIGAALAVPDRLPIAALGDGGFHMSIAELETAVRLGLPLVVVVYNDAAYGAEVHHFLDADEDSLSTVRFPDTDIAAIARGFGCTAATVRNPDDLGALRDWLAGDRSAPLVLDAKIASDGGAWWLAEAFHGH